MLELVKRKPQEDILGLLNTDDGYRDAKWILEEIYGKDVRIYEAFFKDIRGLLNITEYIRKKVFMTSITSCKNI